MITDDEIIKIWGRHQTLKGTANAAGCSWHRVAKALSDNNMIVSDVQAAILDCYSRNMDVFAISAELHIAQSTVEAWLPRRRPEYIGLSDNAQRIKKYREAKNNVCRTIDSIV